MQLVVSCFNGQDDTAHTWWNPRTVKEAAAPEVSADGRTYSYAIPVDTWGVVVAVRGPKEASAFAVPALQAFVADQWKQMDVEVEWGYEAARAPLAYDGHIEVYDGRLAKLQALGGDKGTRITGLGAWRSAGRGGEIRNPKSEGNPKPKPKWEDSGISTRRLLRKTAGRRGGACGFGCFISAIHGGAGCGPIMPRRRMWREPSLPYGPGRAASLSWPLTSNTDRSWLPNMASSSAPPGSSSRRPAATPVADAPPPKALLTTKVDALPGVPLVRGWSTGEIPWFGANPASEPGVAGDLRIPARCVAMHPLPDRDVAVGWRSPVRGRVSIKASVAMGDAHGGNGIEWAIVRDTSTHREVLAHGDIGPGGSQKIPDNAEAGKRLEASVESGDMVSLVVGAKAGNHACDTTIVELAITETEAGGRTWDLTREVVDSIHAGNPHPDAAGHPDVWHFYSQPAAAPPPQPSQPPFDLASPAKTAREFLQELGAKQLATIRQRTRAHAEQTWLGAVTAMRGTNLPPLPRPPFAPAMEVELPSARAHGTVEPRRVAPAPALGQGCRGPVALQRLPVRHPRLGDLHDSARAGPARHAPGSRGRPGPMAEPAHAARPGQRHPPLVEAGPAARPFLGRARMPHPCRRPGRRGRTHGRGSLHGAGRHHVRFGRAFPAHGRPRLAQGQRPAHEGERGMDPAPAPAPGEQSSRPGSGFGARACSRRTWSRRTVFRCTCSIYESEAYYWLAVKSMAEMLARIDPAEGARLAREAEAYRQDLVAAIDRSIALTPVVAVRDGTYHSFIPFAPYVRGFAAGAWGWRRCQGHVGAIYWDTVQSADPLLSPAGLLSPGDPRVQGHLDVLEDRLLLENEKVAARTPGFDPEKDWFAHASWQYQCGLERHANIHLAAGDAPNFLRSMLNQYAVDIMPGEYTFREHTTTGPPDKLFEESCFLERFRMMLVMEEGDVLWLARATPRAWLEQGKRIAVRNAPTHFGPVGYEIVSDVEHGRLVATVTLPSRNPPREVVLVLRHPASAAIAAVKVNGKDWTDFDAARGWVRLRGLSGQARVEVRWAG